VFFGGMLGDKIGLRLASLIFITLVVAGTTLVALGPTLAASHLIGPYFGFIVMIIGRFTFGAGAESLNVIQTSMTTRWFREGRDLAFAMGLVLSASRLGDLIALSLVAVITKAFDFRVALWVGVVLTIMSFIAVIGYSIMDKASEKYFNRVVDPSENDFNLRAIFHFDVRFWILSFLCMVYYSGVFPFITICNDFLHTKYGYSTQTSGYITSVVTFSSMVLSPILGKGLDLVGKRPYFLVLGSLMIFPAHLYLGLTHWIPILPIIVIGLSFSLVPSAIWPSVPLVTKEKETTTAFGLMTAIQNAGLTGMNYAAGKITDHYGYNWTMLFFTGVDLVGLALGLLLVSVDKFKGGQLSQVQKQRGEADKTPSS
jgi:MFS family permease